MRQTNQDQEFDIELPLYVRAEMEKPKRLKQRPKSPIPRQIVLGVALILLGMAIAYLSRKQVSDVVAHDRATVTSQPVSAPLKAPVPRAERVLWAIMPYGEKVAASFKGELPNQEALPWAGNRIGDEYQIGKDYFVWVAPGGIPQWIDPVQ